MEAQCSDAVVECGTSASVCKNDNSKQCGDGCLYTECENGCLPYSQQKYTLACSLVNGACQITENPCATQGMCTVSVAGCSGGGGETGCHSEPANNASGFKCAGTCSGGKSCVKDEV